MIAVIPFVIGAIVTLTLTPKIKGVKAIFDGDRYKIIADLPSGYAKVQDKTTKKWLNYDGTFKRNDRNAHFKILRLEEMI